MRIVRVLSLAVLLGTGAARAWAQQPPAAPPQTLQDRAILVYIECKDFYCDSEYLRTEITFVNHVRDRQGADVHVLGTSQSTAAGGREMMLQFIGQQRFAGRTDTLRYVVPPNTTDDAFRIGLARTIKIGLLRYVIDTPLADHLTIQYKAPEGTAQKAATSVHDPWNFWVMRARMNGGGDGEESSKGARVNGSFSANRVTDRWKIEIGTNVNYNQRKFSFEDGTTFTSVRRNGSVNTLVAKSLNAHWSAGGRASISTSSFANQERAVRFAPGIEFDVFPYSESTRRMLTIQYNIGLNRIDYKTPTVFEKTEETIADQSVIVSLDAKQRWGTAELAFEASHFLNDLSKNHLTVFGYTDLKLFRGFSVNVFSSIERIHDQVYLAAGEATAEEVLVRQRQLLTGYRYDFGFGISYTFGSIFNNVVNPRFRGGPGGIVFF